nr:MAG TPA_asm: hypothetical protein [Caudoviricetes sp.]
MLARGTNTPPKAAKSGLNRMFSRHAIFFSLFR